MTNLVERETRSDWRVAQRGEIKKRKPYHSDRDKLGIQQKQLKMHMWTCMYMYRLYVLIVTNACME